MVKGEKFYGVIGGPPCQAITKLKSRRPPKYPDLTPAVAEVLAACSWQFYLFENVGPLTLPDASHIRLDAMHYYKPHQSRPRWFTYNGIKPPEPLYMGSLNALMAYPTVVGKLYGPIRGAILQGYPDAAKLPFPCKQLQLGLANAVSYPLAKAWAKSLPHSIPG